MRVTPRPVIPIIVGSSINLTCTVHVELNPLVDIPVNVTIEWSRPDRLIANTAQQVIGSPATTYTSTAVVSSSGREQTGNYTCKATVRSMTPTHSLIESVGYSSSRVIVGKSVINNYMIIQ